MRRPCPYTDRLCAIVFELALLPFGAGANLDTLLVDAEGSTVEIRAPLLRDSARTRRLAAGVEFGLPIPAGLAKPGHPAVERWSPMPLLFVFVRSAAVRARAGEGPVASRYVDARKLASVVEVRDRRLIDRVIVLGAGTHGLGSLVVAAT